MMWKAACNQNYKAPENYRQRLCIIHPHLRTLSVADPKPEIEIEVEGRVEPSRKRRRRVFPSEQNLMAQGMILCAFASGAGACRPPRSFFEVAASRRRFSLLYRQNDSSSKQMNVCNFHPDSSFLNERILLLSANLLPFMFANIELWLHKPPTASREKWETERESEGRSGWETFCFIYFFINWIFPLATHDGTSLGILRVKPEVFSFFSRFLFTLLPSETFVLFAFIGIDEKIDRKWNTKCCSRGCEIWRSGYFDDFSFKSSLKLGI